MAQETMKKMKNAVAWFEIPAKNLSRAKKFYEGILDIEMTNLDMDGDFKMSMFPVKDDGIGGALCEHQEYIPSQEGTLVYLAANPDLQKVLDKIEDQGGKILQSKTQITDEYGYMAVFQDSEGNRVALHSDQ